jgi:5-methylcytosine-specific restriction endonuclease McrA
MGRTKNSFGRQHLFAPCYGADGSRRSRLASDTLPRAPGGFMTPKPSPCRTLTFPFPDQERFFRDLLCVPGEDLSRYADLFDFRDPRIKDDEFGRIKRKAWIDLEKQYGRICQLLYSPLCTPENATHVDHVIPRKSNILHRKRTGLHSMGNGRKVPSESLGSNEMVNLVPACAACNKNKKHRFLNKASMLRILKTKGFESPEGTPNVP